MHTACGNVELHFLAPAVDSSLDTASVGDECSKLYIFGDFADALEDFVSVRHLRDSLGMHERSDLNDLIACVDEAAQNLYLLVSVGVNFLVLYAVPESDFTD